MYTSSVISCKCKLIAQYFVAVMLCSVYWIHQSVSCLPSSCGASSISIESLAISSVLWIKQCNSCISTSSVVSLGILWYVAEFLILRRNTSLLASLLMECSGLSTHTVGYVTSYVSWLTLCLVFCKQAPSCPSDALSYSAITVQLQYVFACDLFVALFCNLQVSRLHCVNKVVVSLFCCIL